MAEREWFCMGMCSALIYFDFIGDRLRALDSSRSR